MVICEGAGSPAEINLLDHDLVNLGLAARAGIPAVVVGDIHRGGVFAHLYGTVALLPEDLRRCVKGFIINGFRGDPELLGDAMDQLEARCGVPTLGVLPYLPGLVLDAEDSLHRMLDARPEPPAPGAGRLDVVVLRLPRLSNFTDFDPLVVEPGVAVRFVDHPSAFGDPDLVVLPGTKSTVSDLEWLRAGGLLEALEARRAGPSPPVVLGVCGGFQMLGRAIEDPDAVESSVPSVPGLGWLPVVTRFVAMKTTRLRTGYSPEGSAVTGYEIRHGRTEPRAGWERWLSCERGGDGERASRAPVTATAGCTARRCTASSRRTPSGGSSSAAWRTPGGGPGSPRAPRSPRRGSVRSTAWPTRVRRICASLRSGGWSSSGRRHADRSLSEQALHAGGQAAGPAPALLGAIGQLHGPQPGVDAQPAQGLGLPGR